MDKLRCIRVFIEVGQSLSFSDAAQHLGMSKGNVSKHVAWLEKELEVQLLLRTTKSVSLTESGLALLENGRGLLDRVESIETAVRGPATEPRGVIRIGTPPSFGAFHLVPLINAFAAAHPHIQVVMYLDDGRTDLVAAGLDLTVRIARGLQDSSQVAVRLATVPQVLVAAPAYIARHGLPATVEDLAKHNCMVHTLKSSTNLWRFQSADGRKSVRVSGTIRANFGEPLRHAALLGHGISMHPTYMVDDDICQGRLSTVLPDDRPVGLDIYSVFPSRRNLPIRVRTLLDFMKDWLDRASWHR